MKRILDALREAWRYLCYGPKETLRGKELQQFYQQNSIPPAPYKHLDLRKEILNIAGYYYGGEMMTAEEARLPLEKLVTRVFSDRGLTPVAAALIARTLAHYIEGQNNV